MGSWAGRIRSIGRTAALAVFGTVVGFLLLELLSRVLVPAGSPLERIYPVDAVRAPRPYTMFGGRPGGRLAYPPGTPERLNDRGYRGAGPAAVKPAGELRIFVVGGSTVFEGDPPLPVLLEAQLHDQGLTEVRCFNYGVVSSVSGQDLARLVFEVADLEPDLVGYLSPEWRDRIAAVYVGNLVKAQRVSRAFGSDFVAFFQPLIFFKPSLGPREREITASLEGFGKVVRDLRLRVRLELQRAERQGLVVQDLSDIFETIDEDVFYDIIHITRPGTEILARAMAEQVAARIAGTERTVSGG